MIQHWHDVLSSAYRRRLLVALQRADRAVEVEWLAERIAEFETSGEDHPAAPADRLEQELRELRDFDVVEFDEEASVVELADEVTIGLCQGSEGATASPGPGCQAARAGGGENERRN